MTVHLYRPPAYKITFPAEQKIEINPKRIVYETRFIPNEFGWAPDGGGRTILDWDALQAHPDRCGFDRWIVKLNFHLAHTAVLNLNAATYEKKINTVEWKATLRPEPVTVLFHVIVRPEDRSFYDACILVYATTEMGVHCNIPVIESPHVMTTGRKSYWPTIHLSEWHRDDSYVIIRAQMAEHVNETLYVKSACGSLPNTVEVRNGDAFIPLSIKDMAPGQGTTIKVGFKYFSNVSSIEVTR